MITSGPVSAEQLAQIDDGYHRYELVRGEIRMMSPGSSRHGMVIGELTLRLGQFINSCQLGVFFGAESGFRIERDPDTVLAPDFAFVGRDRIPPDGLPKGYWAIAPDLVVEVLSPDDRSSAVAEKLQLWLGAGVRSAWIVDPARRNVEIHHGDGSKQEFREADLITDEAVLPGFSCPVGNFFPEALGRE
jgi:Uma2 family endonuclease